MKNRKLLFIAGLSVAFVAALAVNPNEVLGVNAEQINTTVVNDNFNVLKFKNTVNNAKWTDYSNQKIRQDDPYSYGYLSSFSTYSGGDFVSFGSKNKIENIQSVQFDYKLSEDTTKWLRYSPAINPIFNKETGTYNNGLVYKDGYLISSSYIFNFIGSTVTGAAYDYAANLGTGVSAKTNWITVKIDTVSETEAKLNCSIDGTFDPSKAVTIQAYDSTLFNFKNCYPLVQNSSDAGGHYLKNLKITSESGTIETDFTNQDFDFNYGDNNFYFWRNEKNVDMVGKTTNIFNPTSLILKGSEAMDCISTKQTIEKDKTVAKDVDVVDVSFSVSFDPTKNEKIGVVLGVTNDTEVSINKNAVVYEMTKEGGALREYDENGNQLLPVGYNENVFSSKIYSPTGSKIKIGINKNGSVTIKENDEAVKDGSSHKVTFSAVDNYAGSVAFASLTDIESDSKICIDDVIVKNGKYYVPVTKSVTHNFSNDFIGNEGYEDFYIHNLAAAGQVHIDEDLSKLVFERCSDGSMFGSAHQYDAFILDFKLCNIKTDLTNNETKDATGPNRWLGLDIARQSKEIGEYGSSIMFGLPITKYDANTGTVPETYQGWLYTDSQSPTTVDPSTVKSVWHKQVPSSLFTAIQYKNDAEKATIKEEDAVCFRYISTGKELTLQLKKASEKEFTSYVTYSNLELSGYYTICCTGYTYWEIDDFSMANTSTIYECADNYEPGTQIVTETEVVYDTGAVDVKLQEEIDLYKANNPVNLVIIIVASVVSAAAIGFGVFTLIKGKKKHEEK